MTRLTAQFLADTLRRRVETAGGFATVLHRGDAGSGAILVVLRADDGAETIFEKRPGWGDSTHWDVILTQSDTEPNDVGDYLARRRQRDPDLWVIEVDVANGTQLIAEWGTLA